MGEYGWPARADTPSLTTNPLPASHIYSFNYLYQTLINRGRTHSHSKEFRYKWLDQKAVVKQHTLGLKV